ncbi:hypothetical protein PVAP13_7KG217700 [Panicum virgatum]|uniref:Uncharacterized protein n=1 Tax=Panicum virgatum TaxID=38727 RepID=A0A8T0QHM4_PANVG|nr:hypothetical protein PVAP13_7KG217700 [Panicum virgatum]
MAGEDVYVDWRGNAVDDRRHGGIRATLFLYVLFMLRSCPSSSNYGMAAYFQGTLHLDIVTSSTVIGYLGGTVLISAALMNFISDAYIKRTTAIFAFGPCVVLTNRELNNCKPVKGWNLTLLYMSLLLFAVGEGCMHSCIPSLGGDQFSNDDPKKSQLKTIIGLVFLVWIDNNLGWNIGFMICALIVLVGLLGAASGMPFYRMQKPIRSPLTTTLEVLVISSKKRQAIVEVIELQETGRADCIHESGTTQVDETKAITRMLPIFISCLVIYLPFTLLMTLTIQVGSTMDKGPCYSRILTPLLRITIGHECICGTAAAFIATLVEAKRMTIVEQHGLTSTGTAVPMSVFWLVIQYFLLSIMDAASFGGLVEFIKSEAPPTMKPIAPALVNRTTRHGDGGRGWLDGTNFNRTRLDHFFLLLAVFELVALINYTFWARRYTRKLQRVSSVGLDEDNRRN